MVTSYRQYHRPRLAPEAGGTAAVGRQTARGIHPGPLALLVDEASEGRDRHRGERVGVPGVRLEVDVRLVATLHGVGAVERLVQDLAVVVVPGPVEADEPCQLRGGEDEDVVAGAEAVEDQVQARNLDALPACFERDRRRGVTLLLLDDGRQLAALLVLGNG